MDKWLVPIVKALASPKVPVTSVALIVCMIVMTKVVPPGYEKSLAIAGSSGFSLAALFFFARYINPTLPRSQRGLVTVLVLGMLAALLVVQARAMLQVVGALINPPSQCELWRDRFKSFATQPDRLRLEEIEKANGRLDEILSYHATVAPRVKHVGNIGPYYADWRPPECAAANAPYVATIFTVDPDRDALTLKLENAPPGMDIEVVASRSDNRILIEGAIITWHPGNDQIRSDPYLVTVTAADTDPAAEGHTVSRVFPVTVADYR